MSFQSNFVALTGHAKPLAWQARLHESLLKGDVPAALDLPTGLGKTSVMAVWLLALATQAQGGDTPGLPRRLVYVVDRRAIVDQATAEAEKLQQALDDKPGLDWMRKAFGLEEGSSLPVSTLRGKLADNRAWLAAPALPAIIVGTVDMIGSRLLFSGYGVSRGMRPVHAAMLAVDTLFVLDESHLVPPFERLLEKIAAGDGGLWPEKGIVRPMKLLPLSATGRAREGAFVLLKEDEKDKVVAQRLNAAKQLEIRPVETDGGKNALVDPLVEAGWALAFDKGGRPRRVGRRSERAVRVLIYANSRDVAQKVADALRKRAKAAKRGEPVRAEVELFTGARRVLERETARQKLADLGFLSGQKEREGLRQTPAFLVATSAAEVGVDLDADQMVCDLVPMERMIQRFGRVNRLGELAESHIVVLVDEQVPQKEKEKDEEKRARMQAVVRALMKLDKDASPAALLRLKEEHAELIKKASTTPPLYPLLELAHVEDWSMTSLKEHSGRPGVQPWLRGWVDEEPQTTLLWREHLPWREGTPAPREPEVESFFCIARPHLLEMLEAPAKLVSEVLIKRATHWKRELEKEAEKEKKEIHSQQKPALITLTLAGDFLHGWTLDELADEKASKLEPKITGRLLVAARKLAGLDENGLLNGNAKTLPGTLDSGWEEAHPGHLRDTIGYRVRKVAAGQLPGEGWRRAHEQALTWDENGDPKELLTVDVWRARDRQLEGDPAIAARDYLLKYHLDDVAKEAAELSARLHLPEHWQKILHYAAIWHDVGKNRMQWQFAANAPLNGQQRLMSKLDADIAYAKTRGPFRPTLLGGYRHEFGSLVDAQQDKALNELPEDERDLVLHLVAAHHGNARPLIHAVDPLHPPSRLKPCAQEAALRFARLQKRYGPWGLAWLEALLRAADRKASVAITTNDAEKPNAGARQVTDG